MDFYSGGGEVLTSDGFAFRTDHPKIIVKAILDLEKIDQARAGGLNQDLSVIEGALFSMDTNVVREILFGNLINSFSLQGWAVSIYSINIIGDGEIEARIAYFNALFLHSAILTGYIPPGTKMKDLYGKTLLEGGFSEQSDQTFREQVSDVLESGEPKVTERDMTYPNRDKSKMLAQVIPITDDDGKVVLILNALKDMGPSLLGHTLESRVVTAALDALGRLPINADTIRVGYTLNHDGRNKIMAMLGNSDLAITILDQMLAAEKISQADYDELMACMRPLLESSKDLLKMLQSVRELLDRREESYLKIDIKHKVRGILFLECARQFEEFTGELYQGQIMMNVSEDFQLVAIPYLVRMVIGNILKNAMDAIFERVSQDHEYVGNGKIRIECHMDDRANSVIEISDNGVGMDEILLKRIFSLGFSTKTQNKAPGVVGGDGIGLANIRDYIDLQKGTIDVESEKGVGTTFRLSFPPHISFEKAVGDSLENHNNK